MRSKILVIPIVLVFVAAFLGPVFSAHAITVQYQTLASFDFLSADEISNFINTTLTGETWNSWNTTLYGQVSYTVADGKLNITSTSGSSGSKEGLLLYDIVWTGYIDVVLDQGIIAILDPANATAVQTGYEIIKDSSGINVYLVNGTSKTVVSSLSTTATEILVSVLDGQLQVKLADGTEIYTGAMEEAVFALGAPAGGSGIFDKVVLYGTLLAGTVEIDLGSYTLTPTARVAAVKYDVSKYTEIDSAKLIVKITPKNPNYARFYIIDDKDPGTGGWWHDSSITSNALRFGIVTILGATVKVDVLDVVKANPSGTFYIGVSVFDEHNQGESWTINVKLVLDASVESESTTTEQASNNGWLDSLKDKWSGLSDTTKYLLLGVGIVIILIIVFTLGVGKKGGIAPLLAIFIVLLILGGIAAALLAWLHPEYLTALAFGLGAIALIALFMLFMSGKNIPNPLKK